MINLHKTEGQGMTDYSELVKALRDIEKTMFALGTSPINMGDVSISLAYDKRWGQTAERAAAAIEALDCLLDQNTQRCEALRKQLREAHESYERHLNELEAQLPKRGKWIIDGAYTYNLRELNGKAYEPVYRCSCCNRQTESYLRLDEPKMPEDADFPEYCPHCGAKMEV